MRICINIFEKIIENHFLALTKEYYPYRVKRKITDVYSSSIFKKKSFTRFRIISSQQNFKKNIYISQKHAYLHSATLC